MVRNQLDPPPLDGISSRYLTFEGLSVEVGELFKDLPKDVESDNDMK